jgi:hypothetical protein
MVEIYLVLRKYPILEDKVQQSHVVFDLDEILSASTI